MTLYINVTIPPSYAEVQKMSTPPSYDEIQKRDYTASYDEVEIVHISNFRKKK